MPRFVSTLYSSARELAPPVGVLAVFLVCFLIGNWSWFHTASHEPTGDVAANLIQVQLAKTGDELLGPYSRFGFHHPGPASMYIWALGDDLWSRFPAMFARVAFTQLLANILAIAAAGAIIRRVCPVLTMPLIVAALVSVILGQGGSTHGFLSIWGPRVVIAPTFLFLVASSATLAGAFWAAPLGAIASILMVHNHLGLMAIVVPVGTLVLIRLLTAGSGRSATWLVSVLSINVLGFIPAILEQLSHRPGNIELIVNVARSSPGSTQSVHDTVSAIGWALFTPLTVGAKVLGMPFTHPPWSAMSIWGAGLLISAILIAVHRQGLIRYLYLLSVLTVGLAAISAAVVPGSLNPYLFLYLGVPTMILLVLLAHEVASAAVSTRSQLLLGRVSFAGALAFVFANPVPLPGPPEIAKALTSVDRFSPSGGIEILLPSEGSTARLWPRLTGIVLQLREAGWRVHTAPRWDHLIQASSRAPARTSCPVLYLFEPSRILGNSTGKDVPDFGVVVLDRSIGTSGRAVTANWRLGHLPMLQLGEPVSPSDSRLDFEGWHGVEGDFRWSAGRQAHIRFRSPPGSGIQLLGGVVGTDSIAVFVNDTALGIAAVNGFGPHEISFPVSDCLWKEGTIQTVTIVSPAARRPTPGSDRVLGFHLTALRILP